jgi:hypothetical protein
MKTELSTYEQQAIDFCESIGLEIKATFVRNGKYFDYDKETRDIYAVSFIGINRKGRDFDIQFGQSIAHSGAWICKDKNKKFEKTFSDKRDAVAHYSKYHTSWPEKNKAQRSPTAYDVLVCITKYDPGTFEEFCSEFGCDTDSRKAEKTYNAVCDEWRKVRSFFKDSEIEQLQEIQ